MIDRRTIYDIFGEEPPAPPMEPPLVAAWIGFLGTVPEDSNLYTAAREIEGAALNPFLDISTPYTGPHVNNTSVQNDVRSLAILAIALADMDDEFSRGTLDAALEDIKAKVGELAAAIDVWRPAEGDEG